MRDAIHPYEEDRLVKMLRSGLTWDEVRGSIADVSPDVLDKGFRERCFRIAGIEDANPPQGDPPPNRKKKG